MNKDKIIKESKTFTEIINNKNNIKNKYFSIYYQKNSFSNNLYGITVPKKVGKANIRNKIKRRIKNIIINNEKSIKKCYKYVIIIKEASLELTYADLEKEILNLFEKVRND